MEAQDNERLTELQTRELLEIVLAGVQNGNGQWGEEKFNSREFYEWIAGKMPSLRMVDWKLLKDQMQILKAGYLKAAVLQEGADNKMDHLIEYDVAEQINEICPFWDLLSEIYGTSRTHKTESENDYYDNIYNAVSAESFQNNSDSQSQPMEENDNEFDDGDVDVEEEEEEEEDDEQKQPFEEIIMTEKLKYAESSTPIKRRRANTTYRWRDKETRKLLDAVLNAVKKQPKRFEQPSARQFYGKIFPEVHFLICKSKMRHLKTTYKSAMDQTSPGFEHLDDEAHKSHLQRVCPFWTQLHRIFGTSVDALKVDNTASAETHIKIEPVLIIDDVQQNESYQNENEDVEDDEVLEPTKPQQKHERSRTLHRWSNEEINYLLKAILKRLKQNRVAFEKPTAQIFYENIFPSQGWGACKGKVRYLKESYIMALAYRRKNPELSEDALNEEFRTICPYWKLLRQIFGARSNSQFNVELCAVNDDDNDDDDVEHTNHSAFLAVQHADVFHKDDAESSHSEDPYPFENEDAVYNTFRPAKKRNYKNGMHRWQHNETLQLLKMVLSEIRRDPLTFEKPTAQMFYEKVFPAQSFRSCQGRMRYLKRSYVSAVELRKRQMSVNLELDEDAQKAAIRKVCPFWDLLNQIHGLHTNPWDNTFFIGASDHEQDEVASNSSLMLPATKLDTSAAEAPSKNADSSKFNDEGHNLTPERKTRLRIKGVHRWNHSETKKLLKNIVNEIKLEPDDFERPTARQFYTKVYPQQSWSSCKFRLRYLKTSYVAAVELREQQQSIKLKLDEDALKEQIRKVCPYWDLLHHIHGQRLHVKDDTFLIGLSADEDDDDDENENDAFVEAQPEEVNHLTNSNSASFVNSMSKTNDNSKLSLQEDVLKLERAKVVNDLEMRKLELQHQYDLRRLELERDERLALARLKLEVESQERLKKYELDLKLKNKRYPF